MVACKRLTHFVAVTLVLLGLGSVLALLNVLFGDVAKIQVLPDKYLFVLVFAASTAFLVASTVLVWKRKPMGSVVFGLWTVGFALYLTNIYAVWSQILLWLPIPIVILAAMIIDLRRTKSSSSSRRTRRFDHCSDLS